MSRSRRVLYGGLPPLLLAHVLCADLPCPSIVAATRESGVAHVGAVTLSVSLQPTPTAAQPLTAVSLRFDKGGNFRVEPETIDITSTQPALVTVTVPDENENPGLIRLLARPVSPDVPPCVNLDQPVDVGFEGAVTLQLDADNAEHFRFDAQSPHESIGTAIPQPFRLRFVTRKETRPVRFSLPITTELSSSEALLSSDGRSWTPVIRTTLKDGWSNALFLKPTGFAGDGTIRIDLTLDAAGASRLTYNTVRFSTHAPFSARVGLAALGGLVYTVITVLTDKRMKRSSRPLTTIGVGILLGSLAAAFLEEKWLPLHVSKADTWGYVLTGVFFASLGLDGVIKRLQGIFKPA